MYSEWLAVFLFVSSLSGMPFVANAGLFSAITNLLGIGTDAKVAVSEDLNSQNVPVLHSSTGLSTSGGVGGGDILVVGNEALISATGPSGTLADVPDTENNGQISKYTVHKGDTLSSIAKMFGVSVNTIIWANDVTVGTLHEGQTLVILPVSGTLHTVAAGDTLKSIAKKYKADIDEIAQFNGVDASSSLAVGDSIIIPDGEGGTIGSSVFSTARTSHRAPYNPFRGGDGPDYPGYYIRPLAGGVLTQGLHGWNAVDLGTPVGSTVFAAAAGEVIISRTSGWNGGYGRYIVISHYNGTQTLYAHLSGNFVSPGDKVSQGQMIGLSGNTGDSTGPHLHFEVRGAKNPFAN